MTSYAGHGSEEFKDEPMAHMEELGLEDEDEEAQFERVAMESQTDCRKWLIGLAVVLVAAMAIGIGVSVATAGAQAAAIGGVVDAAAGSGSSSYGGVGGSALGTPVVNAGDVGFGAAKESANQDAISNNNSEASSTAGNTAGSGTNSEETGTTEQPQQQETTVHVHSRLEVGFTDSAGNAVKRNLTSDQVDWFLNQTQHFYCKVIFPDDLPHYDNLQDCYLLLPEWEYDTQTLWYNLAAQFDFVHSPYVPGGAGRRQLDQEAAVPDYETLFNEVTAAMDNADLDNKFRFQFEHTAAATFGANNVFGTVGSTKVVHVDSQGRWPEGDTMSPPPSTIMTEAPAAAAENEAAGGGTVQGSASGEITRAPGDTGVTIQGSASGDITRAPGDSGETIQGSASGEITSGATPEAGATSAANEADATGPTTEAGVGGTTTEAGATSATPAVPTAAPTDAPTTRPLPSHDPVETTSKMVKVDGLLDFKMIQGLVGKLPSDWDLAYCYEKVWEFYSDVLPDLIPYLHSVDIEPVGPSLVKGHHGNNDMQVEYNTVFYFDEDYPGPLPKQVDLAMILQDGVNDAEFLNDYVWKNQDTLFFKTETVDYNHPYHQLDAASTSGENTMTLESTLHFAFWDSTALEEPTEEMTAALMDQTKLFYNTQLKLVLKDFFVNITYFRHVGNTFDQYNAEPLSVDFIMTIQLDPTQATKANVDAGLLTLDGLGQFMATGLDYQVYVQKYCWKLKGSMFFKLKGVTYTNKQTAQARNLRRHLQEYVRLFL